MCCSLCTTVSQLKGHHHSAQVFIYRPKTTWKGTFHYTCTLSRKCSLLLPRHTICPHWSHQSSIIHCESEIKKIHKLKHNWLNMIKISITCLKTMQAHIKYNVHWGSGIMQQSTFTQILYLSTDLRYLYFEYFHATMYFYSRTIQRDILYFGLYKLRRLHTQHTKSLNMWWPNIVKVFLTIFRFHTNHKKKINRLEKTISRSILDGNNH